MPGLRRRRSNHRRIEGEAVLDGRDEGETLRSLARLRNALSFEAAWTRNDRGDRLVPSRPSGRARSTGGIAGELERVATLKYFAHGRSA